MKKLAALLAIALVAGVFVFRMTKPSPNLTANSLQPTILQSEEPESASAVSSVEAGLERVTITDPNIVFQKAFWRRLQAGDRVLHAERVEWRDARNEVARWQWFTAFEPSSETRAWLATNPFLLSPIQAMSEDTRPRDAPDWFPDSFPDHHLQQSANGRYFLAISSDGTHVYGTDWGSGFHRDS